MIKFFRRIRYNLMETKPTSAKASAGPKTAKYLKYAIGEIVLVVIGILIAENLAPTLKGGFSNIVMK